MMTTTLERKWQLVKIRAGDWLLPSNDRETLWRVQSYLDGPSMGLTEWSRDVTVWAVYRWTGALVPELVERALRDELDHGAGMDYNLWETYGSAYSTRREAIDDALRAG